MRWGEIKFYSSAEQDPDPNQSQTDSQHPDNGIAFKFMGKPENRLRPGYYTDHQPNYHVQNFRVIITPIDAVYGHTNCCHDSENKMRKSAVGQHTRGIVAIEPTPEHV